MDNNFIGVANFKIAIYNLETVEYTDKETGNKRMLNRCITDQGIVFVSDDVAKKLSGATLLHPVQLSARVSFKEGRPQYYFS